MKNVKKSEMIAFFVCLALLTGAGAIAVIKQGFELIYINTGDDGAVACATLLIGVVLLIAAALMARAAMKINSTRRRFLRGELIG